MKQKNIQNLVIAALFAAIICVATFVVKIPSPATNGYLNLGDCFVLLAGFLLNPLYAVLAAGIGSALADVLAGYAQYAPATFIIKALMALSVFIIIKAFSNKFTIVSKLCSGFAQKPLWCSDISDMKLWFSVTVFQPQAEFCQMFCRVPSESLRHL